MRKIGNYINGKVDIGISKKDIPIYDPSTGEIQARVIASNENDLSLAIESSKKSFISSTINICEIYCGDW